MRSGRPVLSCVEESPVAVDEPLVAGWDGMDAGAGAGASARIEGQMIPVGEGDAHMGAGTGEVTVHARVGGGA